MALKTLEVKIGANTTGFQRGLKQVKSGLSSITNSALSAAKAGLAFAGVTVGLQQLGESFKSYLSLESSVKRVNELFASSAKYIKYFAANTASSFGMAETAAYKYAAVYGNLFRGITASTEENAKVTTAMLKASAVVASKTGRTMDDVMERMRSGLLGNTEAIEDLGIQVNVANLELTDAFKTIANGRSWEKLNYNEQQQIRTLAILEQAQKNFGDEVEKGSAYSLSTLSGAFSDLQASMGMFLNAGLQPVIQGLTELVKWANAGVKSIAAYFGFDAKLTQAGSGISAVTNSQDALTDSINGTAEAQKKLVAGFDEVNIIAQADTSAGTGGTSPGASGTSASVFDSLPELELDDDKKLQEFSENLKKIEPFLAGIGKEIRNIDDAVNNFYDKYLYDWLVGIGSWISENPEALEKLGKGLVDVAAGLAIFKGLKFIGEITGINKLLGKIGEWILGTIGITDAMKDKNKTLSDQTEKTKTETSAVGNLVTTLVSAAAAAILLGKGLSGIEMPIPEPIVVPAIDVVTEFIPSHELLKKPLPVPETPKVVIPAVEIGMFKESVAKYQRKVIAPYVEPVVAPAIDTETNLSPSLEAAESKVDVFGNNVVSNFESIEENIETGLEDSFTFSDELVKESLTDISKNNKTFLDTSSNNFAKWGANFAKNMHDVFAFIPTLAAEGLNIAGNLMNTFFGDSSKNTGKWGNNILENVSGFMKKIVSAIFTAGKIAAEIISKLTGEQLSSFWGNVKTIAPYATIAIAAAAAFSAFALSGGSIAAALPALVPVAAALPTFANGGVIDAPTVGLMGEYPNAASNPEIVSPRSTIYDTVVEANAPMVTAIVTAIQRLEQTLREKDIDISIGDDIIARSAARGNNDYMRRTGKSLLNP